MIGVIYIVIILVLAFLIGVLWYASSGKDDNITFYDIISAGEADKETVQRIEHTSLENFKFQAGDTIVRAKDFIIMIVRGESMSLSKIHNGDAVFVKEFINDERYLLTDTVIVALQIDSQYEPNQLNKAKYKLRRFLTYYNYNHDKLDELHVLIDNLKQKYPYIGKDSIEEFFSQKLPVYEERYVQVNNPQPDDRRTIISVTWDNEKRLIHLSIHPTRFLFGVVKYALDSSVFNS